MPLPCTSSPPLSIFQIRRKSPEVASRSGAFPRQEEDEGEGAPPAADPERSGMNATRVGGNGCSNPRAGSALRTPASSSTGKGCFVGALNGEKRERGGREVGERGGEVTTMTAAAKE